MTDTRTAQQSALPEPGVKRFSPTWFGDMAIRYAMVIVMVLIIAFFLYRSARFGTVENLETILIAAAPFALIALGRAHV